MENRCAEIETGNNHLMEEMTKLTREFAACKDREQSWREEVDRFRSKISCLEEENRSLHEQLLSSQNVNQLTQVSIVASQTSCNELQGELERLTKEMQDLCFEKEGLLVELQQLQESTNATVALLQSENKQLTHDVNQMARELQDTSNEKAELTVAKEQEKVTSPLLNHCCAQT